MRRFEDWHRDMHSLALLRAVRDSLGAVRLGEDAECSALLASAREDIEQLSALLDQRMHERLDSVRRSPPEYSPPSFSPD